ncbi:MAG: VWA domain-containing protein [Syntrophomonadaceae bacterium]|jgi:magnesium chelatase subunit D|nr:VWA domain-containing protein [Thermoanaerobacterales bacterium]NLN20716.1 VWA domain-containing protein [Syntrophomonadaceae bacterium]
MSDILILDTLTPKQLEEIEQQITTSLAQKQGFILGESTVVSYCLHSVNPFHPEEIRILTNKDAGQSLVQQKNPGRVIHIDIYHEPAVVKIRPLVLSLAQTVKAYLHYSLKGKDIESLLRSLYKQIAVRTGDNSISLEELLNPMEKQVTDSTEDGAKKKNHVHLLVTDLLPAHYTLIPCLVDAVESELHKQEIEIRKVENIIHVEKREETQPLTFIGLRPEDYKFWNLAMSLSTILSGPDDVIELLQNFQPGPFRRKQPLSNLRNRNGNLRGLILGMSEVGLIKRGWFADTLTKEGHELLNFMLQHKNELEAQLRRMIRKLPVPQGKYRSVRNTHLKSRQKQYSYVSKTTALMKDTWLGSIAIPETMIEAAKKKVIEKRPFYRITREDIRVHEQEITQPVDMCLVLDGSASMVGPKMKALRYLVEHLFLVTRDKVSVVVFQGRQARVAVPFTRNYSRLKAGLKSLQPQGLTPLADGLVQTVKLIKNRQVRNPLLILITDGVPTTGKWTINPREDALKAAEMIKETRAKLICIGVASNQEFLEELAEKADGNVYILDNLEDHATLIEIVHKERRNRSR